MEQQSKSIKVYYNSDWEDVPSYILLNIALYDNKKNDMPREHFINWKIKAYLELEKRTNSIWQGWRKELKDKYGVENESYKNV